MDPILGQVTYFPWLWTIEGWMICRGQVLQISQNAALFALLGTSFGGDGRQTFALPDLRPKENGVPREWNHGELVPQIAIRGIFPPRQ